MNAAHRYCLQAYVVMYPNMETDHLMLLAQHASSVLLAVWTAKGGGGYMKRNLYLQLCSTKLQTQIKLTAHIAVESYDEVMKGVQNND